MQSKWASIRQRFSGVVPEHRFRAVLLAPYLFAAGSARVVFVDWLFQWPYKEQWPRTGPKSSEPGSNPRRNSPRPVLSTRCDRFATFNFSIRFRSVYLNFSPFEFLAYVIFVASLLRFEVTEGVGRIFLNLSSVLPRKVIQIQN